MNISEINFNNLKILHICKTNLKNSYISVKKSGEITLKTPKVSNDYIQKLLTDKESWIRKQLETVEKNPPNKINIQDEVVLFGEVYSIDVDEVRELRECLKNVAVSNIYNISKCYDKFYKNYAQSYITPRVEYYSNIMNLKYSEIKFRKMRSRWGSCSSRGVITLNTGLIKIDKRLIDFIVVHELAHLVHMNHSKRFHSLVEQYMPNVKALNRELKSLYHLL